MEETAHSALNAWESFYVIVGSSGAALTGLQFVVIALIAESRRPGAATTISAFGTPTVVHFCAVLLISAIMSAPWHSLANVAFALGACGLAGVVYGLLIISRARRQTAYQPVWEDWLWFAILPLFSYMFLLVSSFILRGHPQRVLFMVAATCLLLLFIGIHNAWDTVTYIAIEHVQKHKEREGPIEPHDKS